MSPIEVLELPWWWCELCDADSASCSCNDLPPMAGWPDGWDAAMLHVIWFGRPRRIPLEDVRTVGGLL